MQVTQQLDDGNVVVEMTQGEALMLGCLDDAWQRAIKPLREQGPPGSFWYHNVHLDDAFKAVAAWAELGARINGIRVVLDDLDGLMRETPKLYDIWSGRVWMLRLFWLVVGVIAGLAMGAAL